VKIEIPRILLELRADKVKAGGDRAEKLAFQMFAWIMRHPKIYARLASIALSAPTPKKDSFFAIGPLKNWLSQRDLPVTPAKSFRDMWKERSK
jgi:L-lactate utilization protein LutB